MLMETIIFSCSAAGAVLGGCNDDCITTIDTQEVIICEQESSGTEQQGESTPSRPGATWQPPKPWILCEIYVSGGVEIPTFGTTWVQARQDSRECLDEKPYTPIPRPAKPATVAPKITDYQSVQEIFRASPSTPNAFATPSELYYDEPFSFRVQESIQSESGWLFDKPVTVRFVPKSARWNFGSNGFATTHIFGQKGEFSVRATVTFQVDYKPIDGGWQIGAGEIEVSSNSILISALQLPRETRLVN